MASTQGTPGLGRARVVALVALALCGCQKKKPGTWTFQDVAPGNGLNWTHYPATITGLSQPSVTMYDHGSGVAAGDFNGDGHADVLLLGQCGPVGYFLGDGTGHFTDRSALFASLNGGVRVGVTYGDYDNDGLTDFYITFVDHPNALMRQNADGTFTDVAPQLGLDRTNHYAGATFVDIDGDGDLDLVVAGTMDYTTSQVVSNSAPMCPPVHVAVPAADLFSPTINSDPTLLFVNTGAAGGYTFTEEGASRGMPPNGTGLQQHGFADVQAVDYDRDGDMDLVIAELFNGRTTLLQNDGTGHFTDVTAQLLPQPSWGVPAAVFTDLNNDGWPDLMMIDMHSDMWAQPNTSFAGIDGSIRYKGPSGPLKDAVGDNPTGPIYGNTVWINHGGTSFTEESAAWHAETFMPWGLLAADFDNDGDMDVFLSSGMSDPYDYWPNAFLENLGNQFQQRQADLGLDPPPGGKYNSSIRVDGQVYVSSTRTAASADFNEDGALDMVVVRWNDTANLYLNRLPAGSHWLDIDLVGHPTHDPYGSSIEVVAGGATYVRSMEAAHGYFSQSSRTVHFGLGSAIAVTSVTVKWLGGASQIVPPPAVDSHITVTQSP